MARERERTGGRDEALRKRKEEKKREARGSLFS